MCLQQMSKEQDKKEKLRVLRHTGVFYMQTNPKQRKKVEDDGKLFKTNLAAINGWKDRGISKVRWCYVIENLLVVCDFCIIW